MSSLSLATLSVSQSRGSRPQVVSEKSVLRNFEKFTGKYLCQSLYWHATLLKKRLWHRCFPVNFVKFLWIHFSQKTSGGWFFSFFFNYLAAAWQILGHFRGDNLTHPMSIIEFFIFGPKVTGSLVNEVGSVRPVERLVEFEPGTFRLQQQCLNLLGHSLLLFRGLIFLCDKSSLLFFLPSLFFLKKT